MQTILYADSGLALGWTSAGNALGGECDRMIVQAINGPTPVKVRRSAKVTARRKAGS